MKETLDSPPEVAQPTTVPNSETALVGICTGADVFSGTTKASVRKLGTQYRAPFNGGSTRITEDGSAAPSAFARFNAANGSLLASSSNLMIDPSGNCTAEATATIEVLARVGETLPYVATYSYFHVNRAYSSLHLVDRNGPSTLSFSMSQWLSTYVWKWENSAWVQLPDFTVQKRRFLETRNYGVGQGGDDDRSWERADFGFGIPMDRVRPTPFAQNEYIAVMAQIFVRIHFNSTYFSMSNRNDLDARFSFVELQFASNA